VIQQRPEGKQNRTVKARRQRNGGRLVVPQRRIVGDRMATVRDMDISRVIAFVGAVGVGRVGDDARSAARVQDRTGDRHAEAEQHDRDDEAQESGMHRRIL